MGSKSKSSQRQTSTTTQTDNRIGVSDQAVVATRGSKVGTSEITAGRDIINHSIDGETIAGAFDLTNEVAAQIAGLSQAAVTGAGELSGQFIEGAGALSEFAIGTTANTVGIISELAIDANADLTGLALGSNAALTDKALGANADLASQSIDTSAFLAAGFGELLAENIRDSQNLAESLSSESIGAVERISSGQAGDLSSLANIKASGGFNANLVLPLILGGLAGLFILNKK